MTSTVRCGNRFDFDCLHRFTHDNSTPSEYITRPYRNQNLLALTFHGCVAAVGEGSSHYDHQDVYERVILWRVPLLALWATTTLPPFGLHTQIFTLVHLIADPIDTVWSLLYRLDLAKRTVRWARDKDGTAFSFIFPTESTPAVGTNAAGPDGVRNDPANGTQETEREHLINEMLRQKKKVLLKYFHDVPAVIVTAYDEWGYGEEAIMAMHYYFNATRWSPSQRSMMRKKCARVAFYIASDRVSRFLPSVAAGLVFVIQITAGFWKTLSATSDTYEKSNPVSAGLNRAPHNIAFGTLFFWLPFVVLTTALVGSSQTSHMIPRVLEDFREELSRLPRPSRSTPEAAEHEAVDNSTQFGVRSDAPGTLERDAFPNLSSEMSDRWSCGGLPVWQPAKFKDLSKTTRGKSHRSFAWLGISLSFAIVAIPTGCAIAVSWLTPTEGFGCRAMTQISYLIMWVFSAITDWVFFLCVHTDSTSQAGTGDEEPRRPSSRYFNIYLITFARDFVLMGASIGTLTATAIGIFNKCECWCKWPTSSGYISFLQDDFIFQLIKHRLQLHFPIIIGCALSSQILMFVGLWMYLYEGHRVLKQRDMDSILFQRSHWNRIRSFCEQSIWDRVHALFNKARRVNTMDILSTDRLTSSYEMVDQAPK